MQNLDRFRSTSKFGGEYLRNGWRYSKLVSYPIDRYSSRIRRNKSGEIWSSNLGDLDVELYPPKVHFSEDRISVESLGRAAPPPPIFTRARESSNLTSAPPTGGGGPLTTFFIGSQKLALCSELAQTAQTVAPKRRRPNVLLRTLLPGEFYPLNFPLIGLRAPGGLALVFAPNF